MRIGGIPFEKLDALCINDLFFDKIHQSIEKLQNASELKNQFNQELNRIRENIKNLSKEPALTNGLVLSAPSLLDRIASYQNKEITRFRKKEKQTERTIVQYLTRIATKTSPFSTFTQIGLAELKEQSALIENADFTTNQSFVRINNYILKSFKDSVIQDKALVQGLPILINSTLKELENEYEFLVNDSNIEAFQTIETHPVVQLVLDKLDCKQNLQFHELIHELQEEVDAEKGDLERFVLELYEIGLLEFDFNISSLDSNWEIKCLNLLVRLPNSILSDNWTKLLHQLIEAKQTYGTISFDARRELLKQTFKTLNHSLEQINETTERSTETIFKKQFDNNLTFSQMNLLYEDYAIQNTTCISKNSIEQLLKKLNAFIKILQPLQKNTEIAELTDFYKKNYNTSVDLLHFYKAFSTWKLSNQPQTDLDNSFNEKIKRWKKTLKETISIENHQANIPLEALKQIPTNKQKEKHSKSHSAFVQVYQNENQFQCFLNAAMPGYGKYFSRFLHLFPQTITADIKERNNRLKQIFAEINDDSFFNANIHPPLMPFEIKLLDGNIQVPQSQQILLKDIEITLINHQLKLVHKQTKKEIVPFDLGFLSLDGRSELFKLLSAFSEASFSPIHQVINVINNKVVNENSIRIFPRIIIEKEITIQRKTWIIPKNNIPKSQQKHETEWILYKRVLRWVKENDLPLEGFYTINPKELAKDKTQIRNNDAYKPQYINFKNPILVQLFIRSCKKIETSLKLVEMLPDRDNLLNWSNQKYVSEFLFQWKS